jgi:tetratricopeptide (TPR) repeat protein
MKKILFLAAIAFVSIAYTQKGTTSSAGIAYKNYQSNLRSGDFETAAKELNDAKGFIDKSYVHADTKNDPKTLMYFGMIYISIPIIAEMSGDATLKAVDGENAFKEGLAALKRSKEVDAKGRYHDDVDGFVNMYRGQLSQMGIKSYEDEKWAEAAGGLIVAAMFGDVIGIQDSLFYYYGGLAAYNIDSLDDAELAFSKCVEFGYLPASSTHYYSQTLQKMDKAEEAEAMLKKQVARYPDNKDILIGLINFYIDTDRKEEAITVLNDAIGLDPNNAQLIYTAGTLYENMDNYEKAEESYLKAIELDPKNANTLSALGSVYFNKGAEINNAANKLEFGDPNYDKMVTESKDYFKKSVPLLEQAVLSSPTECGYKEGLRDAYGKVGNVDKFKELKQQAADCNSGVQINGQTIKIGMKQSEVGKLAGEPAEMATVEYEGATYASWNYGDISLTFNEGKVYMIVRK